MIFWTPFDVRVWILKSEQLYLRILNWCSRRFFNAFQSLSDRLGRCFWSNIRWNQFVLRNPMASLSIRLSAPRWWMSKKSTMNRIEIDKRVFYKWGVNDGKTWFFQHLANRFPKKHHDDERASQLPSSSSLHLYFSDIKGKENWQFSPPLDIFKEDSRLQVPELFFLYLKFRSLIRLLWGKTPTCRETGS